MSVPSTEKIPTYLAPAIITTVCCGCTPLGIVAIVYAAQVNGKLAAGDVPGALRASRLAKMWSWISFGVFLVVIVVQLLTGGFAAFKNVQDQIQLQIDQQKLEMPAQKP
jgi:Interferon-induced transmembrane protein